MSIDLKEIRQKQTEKVIAKPQANTSSVMEFLNRDIKLFGSKLSDKKKEKFYSDLSILLTSGIDIKTALELIVDEQKKKSDRELYDQIKEKVLNGKSLSETINDTGKFTTYEYYSIKIGEESGRISEVLSELTTYFNKKIKQKRQLVNAFSYPALVLITAVTAVIFMMNFIVPMFMDVFKRFQGELPYITELIIKISDFFSAYIGIFLLLLAGIIALILLQRKKTWYRRISSSLILRTPLIGKITKKIFVSRFCQSMALLIASKTPMLQAIELVRKMIVFYPFEKALAEIEEDIMRGKMLHESMKKFSIFDSRIISLVKVAEEVNQLDVIFDKLNKQYSEELEHQIGLISSLLEPVLIIFVGVLVAVILIAMYLPLFQLSTSIY